MPDLSLRGVTKRFGATAAVDDVSLDIPAGRFVCLLGPSGCGKTTLLRLLAGLEEPTAGQILVGGQDQTPVPTHRRGIGMVFQSLALFPHLSVGENVAYPPRASAARPGPSGGPRAEELLALVELPGLADRRIHQLSGGQRQRVAIARGLAIDPALFLLDEPLSALDANLREHMQIELRQLQTRLGVTTLLVTHDQKEALTMADLVVVMDRGRVQQVGAPMEVYRDPANAFVAGFIGTSNLLPCRLLDAATVEVSGHADAARRPATASRPRRARAPVGAARGRGSPRPPGGPAGPRDLRARPGRERAGRHGPRGPGGHRALLARTTGPPWRWATPWRSPSRRAAAWCSRHEPRARPRRRPGWACCPARSWCCSSWCPSASCWRSASPSATPAASTPGASTSRATRGSLSAFVGPHPPRLGADRAGRRGASPWRWRCPSRWPSRGLSRRAQTLVLVALLSVLSLSEVIVGFSVSTLLSQTAGVGNLLALLGITEEPRAYTPSLFALMTGLVYLCLPLRGAGALPARLAPRPRARAGGADHGRLAAAHRSSRVTVPLLRAPLLGAVILVFVFALGSYLLPQVLGRPQHWTLSVHITDQAIYQSNLPLAAAMAAVLLRRGPGHGRASPCSSGASGGRGHEGPGRRPLRRR